MAERSIVRRAPDVAATTPDPPVRAVVVGCDDGGPACDALALAQLLAASVGARVLPVCVFDPRRAPAERPRAVAAVSKAVSDLAATGLGMEAIAAPGHSPAEALAETAAARRAEAVVVGSSRRATLGRVFAGGTAERLLGHSRVPVAVAPRGYAERAPAHLELIGVAYDFWPESHAALAFAAGVAERSRARLLLLTVADPGSAASAAAPRPYDADAALMGHREAAERALHAALAELAPQVRARGEVLVGRPAEILAEAAAERGLDLLVAGSRRHGPIGRVLLGSISRGLVRALPCPVLVVPRPKIPKEEKT